jgi:CRISPR-associated protein Cmr3
MELWIIEPHDSLIVRDGRPFGPNPGARATSLFFPFPSTTTGGVRTRAGLDPTNGFFDKGKTEKVKKIKVRGPLLAHLTADGNDIEPGKWLVPAPADGLLFNDGQGTMRKRLVPLEKLEGVETDLDKKDALMLVGMVEIKADKPAKNSPHYWCWDKFEEWLITPPPPEGETVTLSDLGHDGPEHEQRTHVSIDAKREAAKDGALFATSGLEFTHTRGKQEKRIAKAQRLALVVAVDDNAGLPIAEGLTSFGGERRPISWRKSNAKLPQCPPQLEKAIIEQKACRVILLTPACFKEGYRPSELLKPESGVTPELQAIAIQRPAVVSGWDLENGKPKPTRRLAPVGTVLFLSLKGSDETTPLSDEAIRNWIRGIWMRCISDDPQASNDGFGLAVLGTWSGIPEKMRKEKQS